MSARSSPAFGSSRPPFRKNVTWAYFSVSAMRSWVRPRELIYSPNTLVSFRWGKATDTLGMEASYSVVQTNRTGR